MRTGPPRRRRARPVADAAIDLLTGQTEEIAKAWLLALLEEAPLDQAAAILAGELAASGPAICAAVLAAIASDLELGRIEVGGPLQAIVGGAGMSGAPRRDHAGQLSDLEHALRAVDALGAVVWSGLRRCLEDPEPEHVAALSERLSAVLEVVRRAVLRRSLSGALGSGAGLPGASTAEDAQPESLWMGAIRDEIAHACAHRAPLALLLAELGDGDRVGHVELEGAATVTFEHFVAAVRGALGEQDILARESPTRAWIIAPDSTRSGAIALGTRVARSVRAAPPWRGAPMTVSVGVAVLGEDGLDAQALIEAAQQACFAAAAQGVELVEGPRG
ncbi:MAG: nucleotidyl cyclase domain-containing protein [Solirubrobacteraceae bacterium]